ncbi:unnamed protein product [Lymnaea stagnalis]|uniref:PARP catalytic domain-containing protein n=1 Tax=Lymnaea stagnalis TaxID=6523 RepID=A0AAV2IG83_LYMST
MSSRAIEIQIPLSNSAHVKVSPFLGANHRIKFRGFHQTLLRLCSLFHKISHDLDWECPSDVGDQTLAVFVMSEMTAKDFSNKENEVTTIQVDYEFKFKAELKDLVSFVDELLSLKEVDDLDESMEMKKLKSKLDVFLEKNHSKISGCSQSWAMNVIYHLDLNYTILENYNFILDCSPGDLFGLQRQIEKIWENGFHGCLIAKNNKINLSKSLQQLGYSRSVSDKIISSIPKPLLERQSSLYWSIRYLKYKLFNDPLLTYVPRYPFKEGRINEWFEEEMEDCNYKSNYPESCQVTMMNVSGADGQNQVKRYLEKQKEYCSSDLFFHGTSHFDAVMILNRGVQVSQGSAGQDFSSGDGFYLSENLQDAKKWAGAGRGKHQAVIVYNLSLVGCEEGLNLVEDADQWQKIVKLCRGRYEDLKKLENLKNVKYIIGPTCKNPITAIQNKTDFQWDETNQLCVRDQTFANTHFNTKNICCVIFY